MVKIKSRMYRVPQELRETVKIDNTVDYMSFVRRMHVFKDVSFDLGNFSIPIVENGEVPMSTYNEKDDIIELINNPYLIDDNYRGYKFKINLSDELKESLNDQSTY